MNNLEDTNKIEIEDSAESDEMWNDLEQYKDAEGDYDLTGMDSEKVIKVLKFLKPEDNLKVVQNGSNIEDTSSIYDFTKTDIERLIKLLKLIMPESNLKVTQNGNNSIQKENCIKADLPKDTKVMAKNDGGGFWKFLIYNGNSKCFTSSKIDEKYDHVIPCSIFDFDDMEKWNCTENDYGIKSRTVIVSTIN